MIEIRLPYQQSRRLPFFLAMEEWVAHSLPASDYIFAWRVKPTVICGRNQNLQLEVNLPYCRENAIDVVRRRSGGGCVYADMNNYMFSFIAPGCDVEANYGRYTSACASMLRSAGIEAEVSGRNDLLAGGAKIAGNAFYRLRDRSIVHGTMLYDFDSERLRNALTPSKSKLMSKAVKSVPMRVTSLKEQGIGLSLEEFGAYAIDYFCKGEYFLLDEDNIAEIELLEQRYYDPVFLYGKQKNGLNTIRRQLRLDGVGEFYVEIGLSASNLIESLEIAGDFFETGASVSSLQKLLSGVPYERDAVRVALAATDAGSLIRNLDNEQLLEILI